MRYWLFVEPVGETSEPVWMIYSDDAVLAEYWTAWVTKGMRYNHDNGLPGGTGLSPINCIDDWVTIHWAVPATPENLINIISAPKPQLL
jgi:hypothetical protein